MVDALSAPLAAGRGGHFEGDGDDGEAALVIRAKVDGVMARLCEALGVPIEPAAAAGAPVPGAAAS